MSHFHKYIQPRYHSDEEFRLKLIQNSLNYIDKHRHEEEYNARRREISRQCYERHKEAYRETRRLYASKKRGNIPAYSPISVTADNSSDDGSSRED